MVNNWSTGERHGHIKPCSPSHSTNAQGFYQAPLLHIGADCSETLFRLNPKRGQRINEGYTLVLRLNDRISRILRLLQMNFISTAVEQPLTHWRRRLIRNRYGVHRDAAMERRLADLDGERGFRDLSIWTAQLVSEIIGHADASQVLARHILVAAVCLDSQHAMIALHFQAVRLRHRIRLPVSSHIK